MRAIVILFTTVDYNPDLSSPTYDSCNDEVEALKLDVKALNDGEVSLEEIGDIISSYFKGWRLDVI